MKFGLVVLLLGLVSISISPAILLKERGVDYLSYMSHGLTLGIDGDLDYSNELVVLRDYCMNAAAKRPCHPIAPGLFSAPWVALGAIVDRITNHPIIENRQRFQGSWSYFGLVFASSFWVFVGLTAYISAIRRLVGAIPRSLFVASILGSSMIVYTVILPVNPHAIEFFALALCFWGTSIAIRPKHKAERFFGEVITALGIGAVVAIRPADLNAILLPVLMILAAITINRHNKSASTPSPGETSRVALRVWLYMGIASLPLLIYNYFAYHSVFPSPKHLYGKHMKNTLPKPFQEGDWAGGVMYFVEKIPNLGKVLFSSEFGMVYTAPMMTFGALFIMLWWAFAARNGERKLLSIGTFLYIGIPTAIVLHWQTVASSYGFRYMLGTIPIGVLGLSLFWWSWQHNKGIASTGKLAVYRAVWIAFILLVGVSIVSQFFIGITPELSFQVGKNVFGVFTRWGAKGYMLAVAHEASSLGGWIDMIAHRLPGVFAFGLADLVHLDVATLGNRWGLPGDVLESGIRRYSNLPGSVWIQLVLLLAFWTKGLYWLLTTERFGPKPMNEGTFVGPQSPGDDRDRDRDRNTA